jgi:hypothetical protein
MTIHSDSTIGALFTFVVMLTVLGCFVAAMLHLSFREFRKALTAFGVGAGIAAGFIVATAMLSLITAQTVVNVGDNYCEDIVCIGIDTVKAAPRDQKVVYTIGAHIFSDANHVKVSAKGARLYLFDEKNRRFPLTQDEGEIPFDTSLDPGQKRQTNFTCIAPADSQHLYLWYSQGDPSRPTPFWVSWYFGSAHGIFRKPVLIRVL